MEQLSGYVTRRIREEIPREILYGTFIRLDAYGQQLTHVTLEASIVAAILEAGVYLDVQLATGRETRIDLRGLDTQVNQDGSTIINIPLSRTGGRKILEVYRVEYGGFNDTTLGSGVSEVEDKLNSIVMGASSLRISSTSDCTMIAPNVLLTNLPGIQANYLSAEVNLSVADNLGHIPPKGFDKFGTMCIERCKQYIYNHHRVSLDRGFVERGAEIGAFKEVIMEYSDAALNYRDLLKGWRRSEYMLDPAKREKFTRLITEQL